MVITFHASHFSWQFSRISPDMPLYLNQDNWEHKFYSGCPTVYQQQHRFQRRQGSRRLPKTVMTSSEGLTHVWYTGHLTRNSKALRNLFQVHHLAPPLSGEPIWVWRWGRVSESDMEDKEADACWASYEEPGLSERRHCNLKLHHWPFKDTYNQSKSTAGKISQNFFEKLQIQFQNNFKQQKQKHIVSLRNMCMMPTLSTTSQRTHSGEPSLPWMRSRWDGRGPCKRKETTLAPFREGESCTQHQEQLKSPGIPREGVLWWVFKEALGPAAASGRRARYLWGWRPSPQCSAIAAGLASADRLHPRTAGVWGSRTRPSGSAPCGPVSWPVGESHGQLDVMHG